MSEIILNQKPQIGEAADGKASSPPPPAVGTNCFIPIDPHAPAAEGVIAAGNAVKNTTAMAIAIRPAGGFATVSVPDFPLGLVVVAAGVAGDVVLLKIAASVEFAGMPRSSAQIKLQKLTLF